MKEFIKRFTEEMYEKWKYVTTIEQLEKETNLRKDAIYKRFGRLRKEQTQNNIIRDAKNADTPAIVIDTDDAIEDTIRDGVVANMVMNDENTYNREENFLTQSEYENENHETVSSIQNIDTAKTGFVTGRTVAYVAFAIVLSVLLILYWPQISNVLKTMASKIHDKITQDDADVVP